MVIDMVECPNILLTATILAPLSIILVAAFNPRDKSKPAFEIYDTDEVEITEIIESYNTVIQNLRLIKSTGHNRWSQQYYKL